MQDQEQVIKAKSTRKPKRILKDISFEHEGAHIALCNKEQGVANGADYVLALKSLNTDTTVSLVTKESTEVVEKAAEGDTSISNEVDSKEVLTSVELEKENNMTQENIESVATETKPEIEMIEKSALVNVEKALADKQVELQKALDKLAEIEKAQKQAIEKAKTDKIAAIIKNEDQRAIITKASLALESEDDFGAFVAAMQAMITSIETSDAFVEKGLKLDDKEAVQISALDRAIAAKFGAKQ